MKLIGLTGGIASGKSSVSGMLRDLGAHVIDADAVYHELIAPHRRKPSRLALAIDATFGALLAGDGSLDRQQLGERVFADSSARRALNELTHPAVAEEVTRRMEIAAAAGIQCVVYDVPLLFERGLETLMDGVIVVWVDRDTQILRLIQRDGIERHAALARLASQMDLDHKRDQATWVIDNRGSFDEAREQITEIWQHIGDS